MPRNYWTFPFREICNPLENAVSQEFLKFYLNQTRLLLLFYHRIPYMVEQVFLVTWRLLFFGMSDWLYVSMISYEGMFKFYIVIHYYFFGA